MLVVLALPGVAAAQQTVTVTTTADAQDASCLPTSCALRSALETVGITTINVPAGTYVLAFDQLPLMGTRTIIGAGARQTIITAGGGSKVAEAVAQAQVTMSGVTLTGGNGVGGQFPAQGGGVRVPAGASLTLRNSAISGNTVTGSGGGIYSAGQLSLEGTTVSGNNATASGGGIFHQGAEAANFTAISASTISGNDASAGGGIWSQGVLGIARSTIAANTSRSGGGLFRQVAAAGGPQFPTQITDTIIAAATGGACAGTFQSLTSRYNIAGDSTCPFTGVGDKPSVNPGVGPLQNNGGQTNTHGPLPGSPAIGGGDPSACTGLDQRGVLRPQQGTCDIGAVEYVAPRLRVVTQVVNNHGGTRDPADFTVHVRAGADVAGSPQPGSATGTDYTLGGGTYTVSADALARYAFSVGGDCAPNGVVALDDSDAKTCIVVADDLAPPRGRFNVKPKSGIVRFKPRGSRRFRRLREGVQIPSGTTIDTLRGRVTLFAVNAASADFYGGIFVVRQTGGARPITRLILSEKLSCARAGKAATTARRKKRRRRLWGSGRGRFRTEGTYSSSAVRGTKWLVEDRCTSTLTRVREGRVAVRDRVKKKTVIVRKGKIYIARAE